MERRSFFALLIGAANWPLAARAQQRALPLVGYISGRTRAGDAAYMPEVLRAFREAGFVDGQTMTLDEQWAEGHYDRVPAIANNLIGRNATVLLVVGTAAANAVRKITTATPIVFGTADDPVAAGLVDSINRPSGNVTGVTMNSAELRPKMLELINEIVPRAKTIYMLANPTNVSIELQTRETEQAAARLGLKIGSSKPARRPR